MAAKNRRATSKFADVDESRKIVFIGQGATGKTSILARKTMGGIDPDYIPTLINNIEMKMGEIITPEDKVLMNGTRYTADPLTPGDAVIVDLQIYDTPGQIEYERLRAVQYSDTHLFVMVCSIDKPNTLEALKNFWYPEIDKYGKFCPKIIVANKEDLRMDPRTKKELEDEGMSMVVREDIEKIVMDVSAVDYFMVSALTGQGIDGLMTKIAEYSLMRKRQKKKLLCTLL